MERKHKSRRALDIQCIAHALNMQRTYLIGLVSKEMDLVKVVLNILQTVCLVPPLREYIKADLTPN